MTSVETPRSASPAQTFAALVTLLVLSGLDQTALSTALPVIARELPGAAHLPWVVAAYLIASTVVIPLHGKLADRWGTRPLLLGAAALFALGSLACLLATSIDALVAARALQGLGGGGLMTLAMLAVAALEPPEQRGRRMGLLGAAYGLAVMLGPQLGALLVQTLSWRWTFALNLPIALAAGAVLARAALARPPAHHAPLDAAGAALLAIGLIALLLALRRESAAAQPLLALLAAGSLVAWIVVERRAADPIVPLALFRTPAFASAAAIGAASGVALFGPVVFVPLYLQGVLHLAPSASALHLLPMMLGLTVAAQMAGRSLRAGAASRGLAVGAGFAMAGGCATAALACAFVPTTSIAIAAGLLPLGLGLGLLFPLVTAVAQRAAPPRQLGIATAIPVMLRALGGALAVAAFGSLMAARPGGGLAASAQALEIVFTVTAIAGALAATIAWFGLPRRAAAAPAAARQRTV